MIEWLEISGIRDVFVGEVPPVPRIPSPETPFGCRGALQAKPASPHQRLSSSITVQGRPLSLHQRLPSVVTVRGRPLSRIVYPVSRIAYRTSRIAHFFSVSS